MAALLESLGIRDRAGIEVFITRLIDMLDELDGDPDLEDGADYEPYLAGSHSDLEYDDAERGIADGDGLAEQCPTWHGYVE